MNIDPNGVLPPLCGEDLKDVMAAAQRLNFDALTDADIGELGKSASEHNPETGFQMDCVVALACGLELKGRQMAVSSDGQQGVQPFVGKLWWNADDMAEAQQMQANYLAKGAISVELKPEADRPIVNVIVALDRNRAHEILGYEVGDEEWLDLSGDTERASPAPRG